MASTPPILGPRIAKVENLLTTFDQYKEWKAMLVYVDGSVVILKSASSVRSGDGLFGPSTVFVDAGDWRPDGSGATGAPTKAALELNPASITGVVGKA